MAIYRAAVQWLTAPGLPRDRVVITPHFQVQDDFPFGGTDEQALANDLATALDTWDDSTRELQVKLYKVAGPPPHYPVGEAIRNANVAPASSFPRELALCLSYYSGRNVKRRRGRLYAPTFLYSGTIGERPGATFITKVLGLAPIFKDLGGVNVDWVVYSRVDGAAYPVTNYYVDDEWDVQRSRGLRPTSRQSGTASE